MPPRVEYIDNFGTKALDAIRDLAADAERVDIAVAFLSYRGWVELRPSLLALVQRRGRLRVIVRRDAGRNSPEVVEELFRLPHTHVAFGSTDTEWHSTHCLFQIDKRLTVLRSSDNETYPDILVHADTGTD